MPIIAKSGPIELKLEAPQIPASPSPGTAAVPTNVLERHRQFISKVNAAPTCFVRGALSGFSDEEFKLHLEIAKIDKYVVDAGNKIYCSKAAVEKLSTALERLKT